MLLELPNGNWVNSKNINELRVEFIHTHTPRVAIVDQHGVMTHHVRLDSAEATKKWCHKFGMLVNKAQREKIVPPVQDPSHRFYLPWHIAVHVFRLRIINRLLRKQEMSVSDAEAQQHAAMVQYDPVIDQTMKDMIEEWSYIPPEKFPQTKEPKLAEIRLD